MGRTQPGSTPIDIEYSPRPLSTATAGMYLISSVAAAAPASFSEAPAMGTGARSRPASIMPKGAPKARSPMMSKAR
jgi:hypothetical protein